MAPETAITWVSIVLAAGVGVYQGLTTKPTVTSPGDDVMAPPSAEELTQQLAATVNAPTTPDDQRLAAGVAALAVAQLKPAPQESRLRTYIWPIVIAMVGIFGPVVSHVADEVDPDPVDCSAYLASVHALQSLAPDRVHLAALAADMHPSKEHRTRCGGTPSDILRTAGVID